MRGGLVAGRGGDRGPGAGQCLEQEPLVVEPARGCGWEALLDGEGGGWVGDGGCSGWGRSLQQERGDGCKKSLVRKVRSLHRRRVLESGRRWSGLLKDGRRCCGLLKKWCRCGEIRQCGLLEWRNIILFFP